MSNLSNPDAGACINVGPRHDHLDICYNQADATQRITVGRSSILSATSQRHTKSGRGRQAASARRHGFDQIRGAPRGHRGAGPARTDHPASPSQHMNVAPAPPATKSVNPYSDSTVTGRLVGHGPNNRYTSTNRV